MPIDPPEDVHSHDLATDSTLIVPTSCFEWLDFSTARGNGQTYSDPLRERYQTLHTQFMRSLDSEKLDISWEEGRLLSAALRDETDSQHTWDDILSTHLHPRARQDMRTEAQERAVQEVQHRNVFGVDITNFQRRPATLELHGDEDYASRRLKEIADKCIASMGFNKIDCSMESLALVSKSQCARDMSDNKIDSILEGIWDKYTGASSSSYECCLRETDNLGDMSQNGKTATPHERQYSSGMGISTPENTSDIFQKPQDTIRGHHSPVGRSQSVNVTASLRGEGTENVEAQSTRQLVPSKSKGQLINIARPGLAKNKSSWQSSKNAAQSHSVAPDAAPQDEPLAIPESSVQPEQMSKTKVDNSRSNSPIPNQDSDNNVKSTTKSSRITEPNDMARISPTAASHTLQDSNYHGNTPSPQLTPAGLGSLFTFMESRGLGQQNDPVRRPYLTKSTATIHQPKINRTVHATPSPPTVGSHTVPASPDAVFVQASAIPCIKEMWKDLVIFLNTGLLKSHLKLVQYLEKMTTPPALVYRDHNQFSSGFSKVFDQSLSVTTSQLNVEVPEEADIIISPTTGILLTTSQALTQLYLPGHKPNNPALPSNLNMNSPVLERIFRLTPRYECLYILVSHCGKPADSTSSQETQEVSFEVDKQTNDAIMSLTKFCDSISDYAMVIPHLIPSAPDIAAKWAVALASKHRVTLPTCGKIHTLTSDYDPAISSDHQVTIQQVIQNEETRGEIYLRTMGLNPFAARLVLDIMENPRQILPALDTEMDDKLYLSGESSISSLSRFLEMQPHDRYTCFENMVGKRVLGRLHSMIEGTRRPPSCS
ncbi:uncharacterized protein N7459_004676 [Penicillium hispanicum]|uniref:uncharacterized protein n=1 Tax=Penicillium hispanicum TaxID=1080232 RepID=UPI0025414F71|nr:uncharacterized protein N7459_004676 [Penicillium hispanicum]KAJ5584876.1 hypothetical protein N7459_004676 [Penicillium hispanicum]